MSSSKICAKNSKTIIFNFGDRRVDHRANTMVNAMSKKIGKSIPQIFCNGADLKGAYRFFENNLVSPKKILEPHIKETLERVKKEELVAAIQDSSDLSYDYLTQLEGFESLQKHIDKGFRIHPIMLINESGTSLGILDALNYTRSPKKDANIHRNSLPIENKESFRWLQGYRRACELALQVPDVTVVSIADREGDIYECLSEAQEAYSGQKAHILVRSSHNRCLANSSEPDIDRLEKKLIRSSVSYEAKLELDKYKSTGRTADIVVRACKALVKAPATSKKKTLPSIAVNAILVSEVDPPRDGSEVYWILITTLPIDTPGQIERIVSLYCKRWIIEIYFKVLKSGCKIDSPHFQSTSKIENFIALSMIVAWKVMLVTYLPREYPDEPCTLLFTEIEWKLAFMGIYRDSREIPDKTPSLKEALELIAMLGGYQKRKTPPGIQTVWGGVVRLMDMVYGYELSQKLYSLKKNPG